MPRSKRSGDFFFEEGQKHNSGEVEKVEIRIKVLRINDRRFLCT
jgi:hypothetical protein